MRMRFLELAGKAGGPPLRVKANGTGSSNRIFLWRLTNTASLETPFPALFLGNVAIAVGTKVNLPGSAALDAFLLKQLKGDGKFSAIISGSTVGGEAHLTLNAIMHASMNYSTGL